MGKDLMELVQVGQSDLRLTEKSEEYLIHDNGFRPFKVVIYNSGLVEILKMEYHTKPIDDFWCEKTEIGYKRALHYKPEKIFIGKSPINDSTLFSGGYGPDFDGNTVLLKMPGLSYMFIGHEIYSFEALSEIVSFVSPVGNSDVPYPYAIDSEGRYYLLIENVVLMKGIPQTSKTEVYPYYYSDVQIASPESYKHSPILDSPFQGITKFHIEGDQELIDGEQNLPDGEYTLTWESDPEKDFKRLTRNGATLYFTNTQNEKYPVSLEMYCNLMRDFGTFKGFQPLNKNIIQKRL